MKNFNRLTALIFSLCAVQSCHADEAPHFIWKGNGVVKNAEGKKVQLELQGVNGGLEFDGKIYVYGDKIDSKGINLPTVASVSDDLKNIQYWPFDYILSGLFIYKNELKAYQYSGEVFTLKNEQWEKSELVFPEDTRIIYTDNAEKLIACHPAPMQKEAPNRDGGCFSLNPKWHSHFVWFANTPKLCGNLLYVYENKTPKSGSLKALTLDTGQVVHEKPLANPPKDLCAEKLGQ